MRLYAFGVLAAGGAGVLLANLDVLIITYLETVKEAALYNIALPSAQIAMILIGPLTSFLHPLVSSYHHQRAIEKIAAIARLVYTTGFFVMLPFLMIFFFYSELAIRVLFGAEYLAATTTLQILVLAMLPKVFYIINFSILAGIGKIKELATLFWIGVAANGVLDFILIPKYSIAGAAFSTGIAYLFMFIFSYREINRRLKMDVPYKSFLLNIINALIFIGVVALLKNVLVLNVWAELGVILIVSGLIYLLLGIFLFKTLKPRELYRLLFRK